MDNVKLSYEKFYTMMANLLYAYCKTHTRDFLKRIADADGLRKATWESTFKEVNLNVLAEKMFIFYSWVVLHFLSLLNAHIVEEIAKRFWDIYFKEPAKGLENEAGKNEEIKVLAEDVTKQLKEYKDAYATCMKDKSHYVANIMPFHDIILKNILNAKKAPMDFFGNIFIGVEIDAAIETYLNLIKVWKGNMKFEDDGVLIVGGYDKRGER